METFKKLLFKALLLSCVNPVQAQIQVREFISCIAPLGNSSLSADLQKFQFDYQEIKAKSYPRVELSLSKDESAADLLPTSSSVYARLSLSQTVYDRRLNRDLSSAKARLESSRFMAVDGRISFTKKSIEEITEYYLLKEKLKILAQKIERQTSLVSVLKDLVNAKSTDGVLLTLTESDLSILKIKYSELSLQIQRIEKSLFIFERLRKLIVDDSILKMVLKFSESKGYQKFADKSLLLSLEYKKRELDSELLSLSESLYPKLSIGVDYFNYLENQNRPGVQSDLLLNVTLTFPISDVYTYRSQRSSKLKLRSFTQLTLDKSKFDLINEDQFKIDRVSQINQSLKDLNSIKKGISRAKDVVSKKFLINRASYSDYIQIDDRVDEVEEQISFNQLEKAKILMFNEIESFFSAELSNESLNCNL